MTRALTAVPVAMKAWLILSAAQHVPADAASKDLSWSGNADGSELELQAVIGSDNGDGGIANGALLTSFAEAVHNDTVTDDDRAELIDAVGAAGLVDAAAVCANFNMMVRIADGTGTPLDAGTAEMSGDLRTSLGLGLGLDELASKRVAEQR